MNNEKTIANNDQPARTGGQFEPETRIISQAMYALAEEIQSGDGVANAVCRQAAERLDAQTVEMMRQGGDLKRQAQKIAELTADRDGWIEAHARLYREFHDFKNATEPNLRGTRKVLWNLLGECLPLLEYDAQETQWGPSHDCIVDLIQRINDTRSVVQAEELPGSTK